MQISYKEYLLSEWFMYNIITLRLSINSFDFFMLKFRKDEQEPFIQQKS